MEVKERAIFHMWNKLFNYSMVLKLVWVSFIREASSEGEVSENNVNLNASSEASIFFKMKWQSRCV